MALEKLKKLVFADIARVNQEDRAAAVRVAEAEVAAMRPLKGELLKAALEGAAEAIADESNDKHFTAFEPEFEPENEDIEILERRLRHRVKGRWLVAYLENRTGAFNKEACAPRRAEERAERGKDALKRTPAVQRLLRQTR